VKFVLLIAFLVSLATLHRASPAALAGYFCCLLVTIAAASLPLWRILRTALLIVPFAGLFSLMLYVGGDHQRAALIVLKTYLSTLAALVCVAATPLPLLTNAARTFYVPAFLLEVTQLIYRYLFLLGGEVEVMRLAFAARGGVSNPRAFKPASGMVAVLFARSFNKASAVHNAMLSRGYSGFLPSVDSGVVRKIDVAVLAAGLAIITIVRFL